MPEPYITVHAKNPNDEALAELAQKLLDFWMSQDDVRDSMGLPRKGREPDYINGRWCVKCYNSLPLDWEEKPCDVCGAPTGIMSLDGLLASDPREIAPPYYQGIQRAKFPPAK